jgi:hypothetical protein
MKSISYIITLLFFLIISSCITQFVPETDEDQNLLVVEGLITDRQEVNMIKLSRSMPLGKRATLKPLKGCTVSITDDQGNTYQLTESSTAGTYLTDQTTFQGSAGRKYTLHINTNNSTTTHHNYQSLPMEMRAVPAIDSLFYEKVTIKEKTEISGPKEGCQVYLNTHDPEGNCKYFRWEYVETWKFQLPYSYVTNNTCWITNNSNNIIIKNTSVLAEDRVTRLALNFISNETDRLAVRYSILVNQYSINEDEYTYWEKLQNISEEVGSLYDITPSSIPGNIFCVEDPGEQVLGYFSVSAKTSKRIYIDESFRGLIQLYNECPSDTIYGNQPIPGLGSYKWIIVYQPYARPPYKVITDHKFCADCTVRGTTTKPVFWEENKK